MHLNVFFLGPLLFAEYYKRFFIQGKKLGSGGYGGVWDRLLASFERGPNPSWFEYAEAPTQLCFRNLLFVVYDDSADGPIKLSPYPPTCAVQFPK